MDTEQMESTRRSPSVDDGQKAILKESSNGRSSKRTRKEWRFRTYTAGALLLAAAFVVFFLFDMVRQGYSALWQGEVRTTVTYTPETVQQPETAFPEEVRDLVSPAIVRQIQRTALSPKVRIAVHYGEATTEQPEGAIQEIEITSDELPIYMNDQAPVRVSSKQVRRLIASDALQTIRKTIRDTSPSETRTESLTGSASLQQYMVNRDDSPMSDEMKSAVELLIKADRIQMKFNRSRFGDGHTEEKWVVLDSGIDQYLKGHYSEVGHEAAVYEQLMTRLGRTPIPDPDREEIMDQIESANVQNTEGKNSNPSDSGGTPEESKGNQKTSRPRDGKQKEKINVNSTSRLDEIVTAWNTTRRIDQLQQSGQIQLRFNRPFFLNGDSTEHPEVAGMKSALLGSVLVLLVVLFTAVPIGVMTSVYLEEFAPDNWLTQLIEININNLAAIPSILYGLLGLAVFINTIGLERSSILVGGLTLSLMTLPIVIISSRSALRSVPDSVRMAGFSMGATRWQVILHHVLPQSLTGILTGSIIGLAQAMGETAPLILIGMVGFFPESPMSFFDKSTVMPAQIFNWWSLPQRAFQSRAALAILLLLAVLFVMNGFAVFLRARTQSTGSS